MMRFDRFTERAQDAANRSIEILQRYGHNQVDTEHILLALLEQPDGVVPQILSKLNVDVNQMRSKLEEILRQSPKAAIYGGGTGQVFITPRVIRSVEEGVQLSKDFEERVAQLKARMREAQGLRLKVQPVLPVPDPTSNIPPGKPQ